MKVTIFGAHGQVGRALQATQPQGVIIRAFAHDEVDIASVSALSNAVAETEPDLVINAAAYTSVDKAEEEEEKAFLINAAAPGYIASVCRKACAGLVHISTDYVFGRTSTRPHRPGDPTCPESVYGATKLAGERAVMETLPEALTVRTAWIYGAGSTNFVVKMLQAMDECDSIGVVADQIGTPTHADSLARAIWKLAAASTSGIHHYTDAGRASWYSFATAIEEEARAIGLIDGCEVQAITSADYPTAAQRPHFSQLDCTSTYSITGSARHWRKELLAMLAQQKAMSGA